MMKMLKNKALAAMAHSLQYFGGNYRCTVCGMIFDSDDDDRFEDCKGNTNLKKSRKYRKNLTLVQCKKD